MTDYHTYEVRRFPDRDCYWIDDERYTAQQILAGHAPLTREQINQAFAMETPLGARDTVRIPVALNGPAAAVWRAPPELPPGIDTMAHMIRNHYVEPMRTNLDTIDTPTFLADRQHDCHQCRDVKWLGSIETGDNRRCPFCIGVS